MTEANGEVWIASYAAAGLIETVVIVHDEWHGRLGHGGTRELDIGQEVDKKACGAHGIVAGIPSISPMM